MDCTFKLAKITTFICLLLLFNIVTVAATIPTTTSSSLAARLKLDGNNTNGSSNCWESLFQLQSCTGEVVLFFLNGETYLGPACCRAIKVIQHDCWPTMLGSLGYTTQEGDILLGYCDAATNSTPPSEPKT